MATYNNGDKGNNTLIGSSANDDLNGFGGNAGNGTLEGGLGNDAPSGGDGQDAFVFREAGAANSTTRG